MASDKVSSPRLVLNLQSFQLLRDGQPIKLEKNPMELLALLARRRGELISREEIVQQIWGDAVHVDVDAGINTAIRKIRQALEDNSLQPRYLETVVGKGYRFIGPITVIDKASPLTETARVPGSKMRSWLVLSAAVLMVALVIYLWTSHRGSAAASVEHHDRLILGLVPLRNLSAEPGQDYFVEGLTDEILTQVGQLNPERLGVVRCASSGTTPCSAVAGPSSPLRYRIEGTVQRDHDLARISIRLVRQADETIIFAEALDRHTGDALVLQSEIAQRIGRELQVQVLNRRRQKAAAPEVVEAYLRGRFELNQPDVIRESARAYFERAIALDPSYAPAYAGLADYYRERAVRKDAGSELAWQLASQNAAQALSLDGESPETHVAMAQIKLMHDWDWQASRDHALRALQLNPSSPEAHGVYARYLRTAGKITDAVSQREQAVALDPFRADLKNQLEMERYFARDFESNVASARQILSDDPNNLSAHIGLCVNLGHLRKFEESAAECAKELKLEGHEDWAAAYGKEYRKHGYEAASSWVARKQLNEVLKQARPDLWELANAYVQAGMREEALDTLLQGLPSHEPGLLQVRADPDFDSLRNEPRYAELMSRIGFPAE